MTQPVAYVPSADYSVDISPGNLGNALDVDYTNLKTTTDQIRANLALLQRDDTKLVNGLVTPDSLSADTVAMLGDWTIRGAWLTATAYTKLDFVTNGGIGYLCLVTHTSGTFATDLSTGKWTALSKADSLASAFTLTLLDDTSAAAWLTTLGISAAAQSILDDASIAAMRTTLDVPATADLTASTAAAIPKSIVDVKGDIILATAADTVARKAVGADGTALIADSSQSDGHIYVAQYPLSFAPNPFFQVDQLANSLTSVADDTYAHDHWYALTQTASVQVSTTALPENGQVSCAKLTQNQAAAQRMGYACIIEAAEAQKLRGIPLAFSVRVKISNSQPVRITALSWTGTPDAVVSDIVNDWTSTDYTDGAAKFFVDANLTPSVPSVITPGAATWVDVPVQLSNFGAAINNLILFVWTEGTAAQNVTLEIGKVRLVPGGYAGDIHLPTFDETRRYAQRFFWKTFNYNVAPAQNAGLSGSIAYHVPTAGITPRGLQIRHPVTMHTSPSAVFYNPSVTNALWRNVSLAADSGAASIGTNNNDAGSLFTNAQAAGDAVGNVVAVHATLSARL